MITLFVIMAPAQTFYRLIKVISYYYPHGTKQWFLLPHAVIFSHLPDERSPHSVSITPLVTLGIITARWVNGPGDTLSFTASPWLSSQTKYKHFLLTQSISRLNWIKCRLWFVGFFCAIRSMSNWQQGKDYAFMFPSWPCQNKMHKADLWSFQNKTNEEKKISIVAHFSVSFRILSGLNQCDSFVYVAISLSLYFKIS